MDFHDIVASWFCGITVNVEDDVEMTWELLKFCSSYLPQAIGRTWGKWDLTPESIECPSDFNLNDGERVAKCDSLGTLVQ